MSEIINTIAKARRIPALPTYSALKTNKNAIFLTELPLLLAPSEDRQNLLIYGFALQDDGNIELIPLCQLNDELEKIAFEFTEYEEYDPYELILYAPSIIHQEQIDLHLGGITEFLDSSKPIESQVQKAGEKMYWQSSWMQESVSLQFNGSFFLSMWHPRLTFPSSPLMPMVSLLGGLAVCHKGHYCSQIV